MKLGDLDVDIFTQALNEVQKEWLATNQRLERRTEISETERVTLSVMHLLEWAVRRAVFEQTDTKRIEMRRQTREAFAKLVDELKPADE
jgi:hypothetical protein